MLLTKVGCKLPCKNHCTKNEEIANGKLIDNFIISCRLFIILSVLYEGIVHDKSNNEHFLSKHWPGVDKFLVRRLSFPARTFTSAPNWACKNGRPKQKSTSDRDEFAKLRALHVFVPYVPSRLMCLDLYAY